VPAEDTVGEVIEGAGDVCWLATLRFDDGGGGASGMFLNKFTRTGWVSRTSID
jgi:hypothetical protein